MGNQSQKIMKAPAKINLTLDVLHKREDGYHEVEMVMTTIDLADRVRLSVTNEPVVQVTTSVSFVPADGRNLAYQAATLLQERFGVQQGAHIYIDKQIPVAAGLAGGSSDAAATLVGLNDLWDLRLSKEALAAIGAEIGSDVSFCVYGGTALVTGRGEKIKPLPPLPPFWVVVAKPPIGVSTGGIYQKLDLSASLPRPDNQRVLEAIQEGSFQDMAHHLGNVLESVTLKQVPQVAQLKKQMERFGGDGVLMSGSGPSVYAITQYQNRARRIYNGLKGFCEDVYLVRSLT